MKGRSVTSCIGASAVSGWPGRTAWGNRREVRDGRLEAGIMAGDLRQKHTPPWRAPLLIEGILKWVDWIPLYQEGWRAAPGYVGSRLFLVLGVFLLLLQDALENFGHVLDDIEDALGNENGALLLQGEDDGVAGARIELQELPAEFVL